MLVTVQHGGPLHEQGFSNAKLHQFCVEIHNSPFISFASHIKRSERLIFRQEKLFWKLFCAGQQIRRMWQKLECRDVNWTLHETLGSSYVDLLPTVQCACFRCSKVGVKELLQYLIVHTYLGTSVLFVYVCFTILFHYVFIIPHVPWATVWNSALDKSHYRTTRSWFSPESAKWTGFFISDRPYATIIFTPWASST